MPDTLLLADDSATIQRVIEMTFAEEGVRVVVVGDGREAVERIAADPPDIVLADTNMPEKDGYDVSAFVKADRALAHIPVVLLTGSFDPVDDERAREVGCDGVLVKPFEPKDVLHRVRELLGASADSAAGAPEARMEEPAADVSPAAPAETAPADGSPAASAESPVADASPVASDVAVSAESAQVDALPAPPVSEPAASAVLSSSAESLSVDASPAASVSAGPASADAPTGGTVDAVPVPSPSSPAPLSADPQPPTEEVPDVTLRADAHAGVAPTVAPDSPPASRSAESPAPERDTGSAAASEQDGESSAQDAGASAAPEQDAGSPAAPVDDAGASGPPAVPAVEAPPPPTLADAFASLLAAEQGDLDRARAAYPWPRLVGPAAEEELIERVTERVVERLSSEVTGELVSEVLTRVAERLVREQIGRIGPA